MLYFEKFVGIYELLSITKIFGFLNFIMFFARWFLLYDLVLSFTEWSWTKWESNKNMIFFFSFVGYFSTL